MGQINCIAETPAGTRLAGIDYGEKRIGVSLSDTLLITAGAFEVIARKDGAVREPIRRLGEIAQEYSVSRFIVGYPKRMDNTIGEMTLEAERFAARLQKELKIPAVLWDERLTSRQAERSLLEYDLSRSRRKQKIDGVAAALILQNYLDYLAAAGRGEKPV